VRLTLTADNLDPHARMPMPLHGVELDVASEHGVVQVVVLHRVRVHVTFEHLAAGNSRNTGKYHGKAKVAPECNQVILCNRKPFRQHNATDFVASANELGDRCHVSAQGISKSYLKQIELKGTPSANASID